MEVRELFPLFHIKKKRYPIVNPRQNKPLTISLSYRRSCKVVRLLGGSTLERILWGDTFCFRPRPWDPKRVREWTPVQPLPGYRCLKIGGLLDLLLSFSLPVPLPLFLLDQYFLITENKFFVWKFFLLEKKKKTSGGLLKTTMKGPCSSGYRSCDDLKSSRRTSRIHQLDVRCP